MAFGRPKTYPHISDERAFVFDPKADVDALADAEASASPAMREWLVRQPDLIPQGFRFFVKNPAQFTDPRCMYHVIDAVVKSKQNTYLRPRDVTGWLNHTQQQYLWGSGAVGRLLAGLAAAVNHHYRDGNVEGVEYEDNKRYLPFAGARDGNGNYYVIDPLGGNEGRLWLMSARAQMYEVAKEQQRSDQRGQNKEYFAKTLNAADAAVTWLADVGCVRTKQGYDAQKKRLGDPSLDTSEPIEADIDFAAVPADGSGVRIGG